MLDYFPDHGLPPSMIFFALALLLFLLRIFPFTGIFLMMTPTALWMAVLVNLGFVGLGIDALTGQAAPGWLLAPSLWFGVYTLFRVLEQRQLAAERRRLGTINARLAFPFDPARQDILVRPTAGGGGDQIASPLLQHHDIAEVYSKGDWAGGGARVHQVLEWKTVIDLTQGADLAAAGIHSGDVSKSGGEAWEKSKDLREIIYPQEPSRPVVQLIALPHEKAKRGTLPIVYTPVDIGMPGLPLQRLVMGVAIPLRWVPMLIVGRARDSRAPAWRRFIGFQRAKRVPLVEGTGAFESVPLTIGRVLGLARLLPEDHPPSDPGPARRQIEKVTAVEVEAELEKLRAMIAAPAARHKDTHISLLRRRPGLIADHAEDMLGAMEAAYAAEKKWGETGRLLASLLADAPDETLQALKPRLLAFYAPPLGRRGDDWRANTDRLQHQMRVMATH